MPKTFLLSAGCGTRLRPLTDKTPKILLPIFEKPLLQIWLEHLEKFEIEEVFINTHWLHEKVELFLNNFTVDKIKIRTFYEKVLLGSAGTLWAHKDLIKNDDPFFILYGDNLTNVNLDKMLEFHRGHDLPVTLGVFKADDPRQCGIAEVNGNGIVSKFTEKPKNPASDFSAAGVYIADKRIFDFYPAVHSRIQSQTLDLGHHVFPNMSGKMKAYLINETLLDIGTVESYHKAQELWPAINSK